MNEKARFKDDKEISFQMGRTLNNCQEHSCVLNSGDKIVYKEFSVLTVCRNVKNQRHFVQNYKSSFFKGYLALKESFSLSMWLLKKYIMLISIIVCLSPRFSS